MRLMLIVLTGLPAVLRARSARRVYTNGKWEPVKTEESFTGDEPTDG